MNFIFIFKAECVSGDEWRLRGARAKRALEVHRLEVGQVRALLLEGQGQSEAEVLAVSSEEVKFRLCARATDSAGEAAIVKPSASILSGSVRCIVGLARPQTSKKVMEYCASAGFQEIHFVSTERGEKSYESSKVFEPASMNEQLLLGAEQGGVAFLPHVQVWSHLKVLFSEHLPPTAETSTEFRLLADTQGATPNAWKSVTPGIDSPIWAAIGPEPGWSDEERELFQNRGFLSVSLGSSVLRVEHALATLTGALFALERA